MFEKFITTITELFATRGGAESFRSDAEIVSFIIANLAGLIAAEPTVEAIITPAELRKMLSTYQQFIDETGKREEDVCKSLLDALNRCRVLKAFSGHADVDQQTSDEYWRETDLLQADLEVALDRIDSTELENWLKSKW